MKTTLKPSTTHFLQYDAATFEHEGFKTLSGRIEWEFGGNCYVTFIHKNKFKATLGSDDTRVEIDRAMEMCK